MRRRLRFPSEALGHLGLLIAFVLIVAAREFVVSHPALASLLVLTFSLSYLVVSLATKRASFLYATMLLGAVSYFLACHALGAPGTSFPMLSVPLVLCLWVVGYRLNKRLGPELAAYPSTVYRAMNITVAVFAAWALAQAPGLVGKPGFLGYVAGLTFVCYALLYLMHSVNGAWCLYIYAFSVFATIGAVLAVMATGAMGFSWLGAMAVAVSVLYVGIKFHADRTFSWSRHFYFSVGPVVGVALLLSLLRVEFFPLALAAASLISWAAYVGFASFAANVRSATMSERVTAKCFFMISWALALPVVLLVFIWPASVHVAGAALVCGFTISWMAWRRRCQVSSWGIIYAPAAAFFISAGLVGLGCRLSGAVGRGWLLFVPAALVVATSLVGGLFDEEKHRIARKGLAKAAVLPVLFAWFVPVTQGEPTIALASVVVALLAVIASGIRDRRYFAATGCGLAGMVVSGAVLRWEAPVAWIICVGAAAVAGMGLVWTRRRSRHVVRASMSLAWLILSIAAVSIAAAAGTAQLLYGVIAVAAVGVLLTAQRGRAQKPDVIEVATYLVALTATLVAICLGVINAGGALAVGSCLLALSAAYWLAWVWSTRAWHVYVANALFSLGTWLIILQVTASAQGRLAGGVLLVLALFLLAAMTRRLFPAASGSAVVCAHTASMVLALGCLIQAWPAGTWAIVAAGVCYALLYGVMPRLRKSTGSRVGAVLWLSFAVLFSLSVNAGTAYWQQMTPVALVSLVWLAGAYLIRQTKARGWSLPMYISAGVLAGFCGGVRLLAPAAEWSWAVFLVDGLVFAALFLTFRQDIFAYLLTLSLSLMAFDWIKASASHFTQDVFFYLIIGSGVLGALFLLPYLRKLVSRLGLVPTFCIYTLRGTVLLAIPVAGMALLLVSVYSLKVTAHPKFCTLCHNMEDYYNSWQHSSHGEVACIECHYEPGVQNELLGKVGGVVQVVKYLSHSYDNKPDAMISNESCMRKGCHTDMDKSNGTLLFRDKIRFRHDKHLAESPRGKILNCVTCHGQTVEGKHISVTETTCLTCHFYGRGKEPVAEGQCLTCHSIPDKSVSFMGQAFEHTAFLDGKDAVKCEHCHSQVTEGAGTVSSTRCRSCHLNESELVKSGGGDDFHMIHVSQGHFDCLQCHDEIRHGIHPMEQHLLAEGNCGTCHEGDRHSLQERIYAGTALPSLDAEPDVMYLAGVACGGCHTDIEAAGLGATPFTKKLAGARRCADCHGAEMYGEMLQAWQDDTKERIGELQETVARLQERFRGGPSDDAGKLFASAKGKLAAVVEDGSFGAHNYIYISEILDSAQEELSKCLALSLKEEAGEQEESE